MVGGQVVEQVVDSTEYRDVTTGFYVRPRLAGDRVMLDISPQRESLSPRVKSLNYLPHILAKIEGVQAGADEVLMLDSQGHVAEGSGQNIFVVKHRRITTPPVYAGILKGVTRDVVIELARGAGYDVQESMLNRYDVYTADEAFFTGTASEVVAIRQVDGRLIGAGKSGPVTRDLRARFQALVRS